MGAWGALCGPPGSAAARTRLAGAGAIAGCQLVEELLYDRGSGNLMATVRVRAGVVQAIVYGQAPR